MSLVRTTSLNGIAVAVRMGTALALNKVLALLVGPAGYALIGQFQNVQAVFLTFATGAINTGVTKATAEYHDDDARRVRLWRTAATVTFFASLVVTGAILIFRRELATALLGSADWSPALFWLAISILPISFNALLLAILNGLKDVQRFVTSNIAGSILSLLITALLAWFYGLEGALIALSVNQAIVVAVTLFQVRRCSWFRPAQWFGSPDRRELSALGGFALMAATTALVGPTSQTLVRASLIDQFGSNYAGYWDAMWRISAIYMTLITTTLTLYYLPRIAEVRDWGELRNELARVSRFVLPLAAALAAFMFVARDLIIIILFSEQFAPMETLFAWQLCGDVVKIASWLFAFLMVGRGLTVAFIASEIIGAAVFTAAAIGLTAEFGFSGVAAAHLLTYLVYLGVVVAFTVGTPAARSRLFSGDAR